MCRKLIYLASFVLALMSGPVFADIPVLAPGDPIIAIDADGNSGISAAELVTEAIDRIYGGANQKYYNSGGANSGFIVTPALGPSVVRSFVIWTANDTEGRDPASWALYGTNEPIASADQSTGTAESWTLIASGPVSLPSGRNATDTGPTGYSALVTFDNTTPYRSYKMLFPTLKTAGLTMQIAEIQFYGLVKNARNLSPADGSMIYVNSVSLTWNPGDAAVSHDIYFSDNFDDVNTATSSDPMGPNDVYKARQTELKYPPADWDVITVTWGKTYYWRIDEVNGVNTWRGDIWSFNVVPGLNWNPGPPDQATLARVTTDLSWSKGALALLGHIVYLSTDFDDVNDAVPGIEGGPAWLGTTLSATTTTIAIPGDLLYNTTYYWRADPVENTPPETPGNTHKGEVWSFTTLPVIAVTDPNLQGWWRFDEGYGTKTIDWSGNNREATLNGKVQWVAGYLDNALKFDSTTSDYVSVAGYKGVLTPKPFSATAWVKTTAADDRTIISWGVNTSGQRVDFRLATGRLRTEHGNGNLEGNTTLNNNEWHHVAMTQISNARVQTPDVKLYLDGRDDSRGTADPDKFTINSGVDMAIGYRATAAARYFLGAIDDVRIYDKELSAAEIPHLMDVRKAWNPGPSDGAMDVPLGSKLTWNAGTDPDTGSEYTKHDVYFGTNFEDVYSGTVPTATVTGINELTPPAFERYERCYWRVDGINASDEIYKGNVWTFKATYDPALIVDPNLVGWWKLDGNADDSSGYGNDGVENGSPLYVDAVWDLGIDFDGVNDYINCGNAPRLNMNTNITVACWVKGPFGPSWSPFVSKQGESCGWKLRRQGGTNNACFTLRGPSGGADPQGAININDNEWHHVAGTYDGAQRNLYVDGQLDTAGSPAGTGFITGSPADDVVIGAFSRAGSSPPIQSYSNASIDDARIYNRALTQADIANVIRFNLAWAWNPSPKNNATGVSIEAVLSWTPGDYAPAENGHYVNLGADDPANMVLVSVSGPQTPNNYTPSVLDLDRTYYWAIDEVNAAGVDKGPIWSFTTANNVVVDDMEGYFPRVTAPNIYKIWVDGAGDCNLIAGNNTGALVDIATTPVHGGQQAMKLLYDNDGTVDNPCPGGPNPATRLTYSKAEALVAQLPRVGSDWTIGGVKALSLWFYGDSLNSVESMWVQLTDGSDNKDEVLYGTYVDEDANDMNEASWHEWLIDLADFTDVNLTNVKSIAIGIGDDSPTALPGGAGTLYFDDISLYAPRCILARREADFARVDYVQDCVVDYKELEVMAVNWLAAAAAPGTVLNGDFEEIYKPGSLAITGIVSQWTQGVGPDCPIDTGEYVFSDATTGTVADIPGWVGYDRDGWIALGGTYGRDQTTGNLQGSISDEQNFTEGGLQCYLSNGGDWGNAAGGLIISDAPLGNVEDGIYTLSMMANGGATPVVLDLLADGVILTPTSSVNPVLSDDWQEFSRTYDSASLVGFLGEPLTIRMGVGRGASGTQTRFDNVTLFHSPEPLPIEILRLAGRRADLYEDKKIDFKDFAELAVWWLINE